MGTKVKVNHALETYGFTPIYVNRFYLVKMCLFMI